MLIFLLFALLLVICDGKPSASASHATNGEITSQNERRIRACGREITNMLKRICNGCIAGSRIERDKSMLHCAICIRHYYGIPGIRKVLFGSQHSFMFLLVCIGLKVLMTLNAPASGEPLGMCIHLKIETFLRVLNPAGV